MIDLSRRSLLSLMSVVKLTNAAVPEFAVPRSRVANSPSALFQSRDLVREVVGASHGNLTRVRELVTAHPALARASWDWGFGDHEAAIDAASHMGNREIAEFLIANGARPTIFTMAMLGQIDAITSTVTALPGVQRMRGPHGITLLAHARAGGSQALEVVAYLERLGDADRRYTNAPLSESEIAALSGQYGSEDGTVTLVVSKSPRGDLSISAPGAMIDRPLFHQGSYVFNPAGAEAVMIRFRLERGKAASLVIEDGDSLITARRT